MLAVLSVLLILGIVFFYAIQGLFSALVMTVCTVICTVMAFTYYEPLAASLLYEQWPAYADAAALLGLFFIPLVILRWLIDRFLPGNIVPNLWVDRIGGAALGTVTALLAVGTLLVAVQMLPLERSVMGYDPLDDDLQPASGLGLNAPGFTLGLVTTLSSGSMASTESFDHVHKDLIEELWATRNRRPTKPKTEDEDRRRSRHRGPQRSEGARNLMAPDALQSATLYDVTDQPYPRKKGSFGALTPPYPKNQTAVGGESRVYIIRARIGPEACDEDLWWRLMGTHFRLVAQDGAGFYPVGYLLHTGKWHVITGKVGALQINRKSPKAGSELTVDLLYRVPHGSLSDEARQMRFVAFRRLSRMAVGKPAKGMPEAEGALQVHMTTGSAGVVLPSGMARAQLAFLPNRAMVKDDLPVTVGFRYDSATAAEAIPVDLSKPNAKLQGQVSLDKWVSGTIDGSYPALEALGQKVKIKRLEVPPKHHIVQLVGQGREASGIGLRAGGTLEFAFQPSLVTAKGKTYYPAGGWVKYTKKVDGEDVEFIHLSYTTDEEILKDASGRSNTGFAEVRKTYRQNRTDSEFGLLFVVPNVTVSYFQLSSAGGKVHCEAPLSVR